MVDDNSVNQELMTCVLEEASYRVIAAASGEEALRLVHRERPSLVIADVLMSGMNGFELGHALRKDPDFADLPLLLWTAHYDSAEVRRIGRSLDVAGVLPKPCDNTAVQSAVAAVLAPGRHARAKLPTGDFEHEQVRVLSDKLVEKTDELERTRGKLRDSEDRFRILVSNIPAAIYRRSTTADMAIELVSDAIEDLTGYAAASLMADDGRGFLEIIHPDDRARIAEELAAARSAEGHYGLAYRIVRADGKLAWVGDRGQVVTGADGVPPSEYGTLSDITERKQLEDEHARMETELRMAQKLEAVGQLAAGIAHEINTPIQFVGDGLVFLRESFEDLERLLGAYRDALGGLMAGAATHDDIRAQLEQAEDAADVEYLRERVPGAFARTLEGVERVASIVRAMKEFAHPQRAQAPADINRALKTTLEVTRNEYKYVAEVVTDFEDLPEVVCNLSDINQVFLNLIVNAAHALQDVRAETGRLGTIRISTRREGDSAVITVADDGPGIAAAIQTRVFDPFFTTKSVGRGTGQGLAIVRSVVERHGGSVRFETTPGAGTTFTIRVPFAGAPPAAVA